MPYSQQKVSENCIHRSWENRDTPHSFLNRQITGIPVHWAEGMMLRYRRHGLHRLGAARARTGCAQEAEGAD